MKFNWLIAAVSLVLLLVVFQFGFGLGVMRAEQRLLRLEFNSQHNDFNHRLSLLETERLAREQRMAWFKKAILLARRIPVVRFILSHSGISGAS